MVQKVGIAIVVFVSVFAVRWWVYFPHSPFGRQLANLELAEAHGRKLQELFRQTVGADSIKASAYSGLGGSLRIFGKVADQKTADAVIAGVLASEPPVTVELILIVGETDDIRMTVEAFSRTARNQSAAPLSFDPRPLRQPTSAQ